MLTRQHAEELLDQLLEFRSELDEAECKSSASDPAKDAICALSNRRDRNGGVLFLGIGADFTILGIESIEKVQEQIVNQASDSFNAPLRVDPEVLERDGKQVLAVIVPPAPVGYRPCHYKKHGVHEGSWIRVGNSTRRMTHDEVTRELTTDAIHRGLVPPFDKTPIPAAGLEILDEALIEDYIAHVRKIRPNSQLYRLSRTELLDSVGGIAKDDSGAWHPTPTGVLFFSRDPQRLLPQSSVEFLHLWGPELTTLGPDGSRWRVNKELMGTLPEIIDQAEQLLLERVATRGHIETFRRRDEPEYPRFALREVVVNAIAHRDYTLRGSRIQIRLYPDRLEVHTPGGLPAPVTVDNIEDEQATRNEGIVALLTDYGYMERRGYGFNGIVAALREAGLAPPQLTDNGASFNLLLKNHLLMSPEALQWLHQFDHYQLSGQERLALAYLWANERLYNRDYVRITATTSTEATQALRRMMHKKVLMMHSTRGGAYYTLPKTDPSTEVFHSEKGQEEIIIALVRKQGSITRRDVIASLQCTASEANRLLRRMMNQGQLVQEGTRKGTRYTLFIAEV